VVRVTSVGPAGIDLDVELQVYNPNSFPLAAENVAGTLYGAQSLKLGEGRSNPRDAIPAEGGGSVSAQLHVPWENLGAIAPLLVSERVPIEFRGDVTFGGDSLHLTLPFTLTGDLTRAQLLQAGLRGL
jgi:LEA14-like dessication related protein